MTDQTPDTETRVEQAREFAALFWDRFDSADHRDYAHAIRRGRKDDCEAVQVALLVLTDQHSHRLAAASADEREAVARAIASKTYAFSGDYQEGEEQYDCGEWEEMGSLAHATYYDAADAAFAALAHPDRAGDVGRLREFFEAVCTLSVTEFYTGRLESFLDRDALEDEQPFADAWRTVAGAIEAHFAALNSGDAS